MAPRTPQISLAVKFILMVFSISLITMSSITIVNSEIQKERHLTRLIERGQMLGEVIATISPEAIYGYDYDILDAHMRVLTNQEDIVYAVVIAPDHVSITSYLDQTNNHIIAVSQGSQYDRNAVTQIISSVDKNKGIIPLKFDISHMGDFLGYVKLGLSRERIDALANKSLIEQSSINLGALIILSLGIYAVFRYSALRSIKHLTIGAQRIANGNLSQPVTVFSKDELGNLSNTFNQMMINLKESVLAKDNALEKIQVLNETLKSEIEDRKSAEQAALTASQAKSTFLANMSHEIRTPMNAVLGYTQILQLDKTLTQKQCELLGIIEKSGDHLLGLINDILDISKIEVGAMKCLIDDFDLADLIQGVYKMFKVHANQKDITFELQSTLPSVIPVRGDQGKLRQVLVNLVGNAIKFTDQGQVSLSVKSTDNIYEFKVSDSGPGIAKPYQGMIFEPFQQSTAGEKKGGTGLGLAISRQIAELMNGTLTLQPNTATGSCFVFQVELEAATTQIVKSQTKTFSEISHLAPEYHVSALVVDDNPENRDVLSTLLQTVGITVTEANNGQAALERMSLDKPDIVFMDINMPTMDGLTAINLIRKNPTQDQIKCIAITAFCVEHGLNDYLKAGFDDYIAKPFRFERVCSSIESLLNVEFSNQESLTINQENLPALSKPDLSNVQLPDSLLTELLAVIEQQHITAIENLLDKMATIGSNEEILAHALLEHVDNFAFSKLHEILESLHHVGKSKLA